MFEAAIASLSVAALSLCGALLIGTRGPIKGTHRFIIPVAIGVFLGVVFFELIPETLEGAGEKGAVAIITGFLGFYFLSHILRTYHHHHHDHGDGCEHRSGAEKLLVGDAIHNIADGVVIVSAFLINPGVGIATTIGIALHEIPQEIAEYSVLIAAGYTRKKALVLNALSASTIFVGVLLSYFFVVSGNLLWVLTGIAAGNLLYIAASDMIPELNDKAHHGHFIYTFISTLIGLIGIVLLLEISHEYFGG